jgi:hypothetical protein
MHAPRNCKMRSFTVSDLSVSRKWEVDGAVTISSAQLGYLLSGIDWRHPQETWRPASVG